MPTIRLGEIAVARSGDKGAGANVGIIARWPAAYPVLLRHLTAERVAEFFAPLSVGTVTRYRLDNLEAMNFLLPNILAGGGSRNLRIDAQGKALGQAILELELEVSDDEFAAMFAGRSMTTAEPVATRTGTIDQAKRGAPR